MTLMESFSFMFATLASYYTKTHNDELGGMLGGFDNSFGGKPFDPAAWNDWVEAVKKVSTKDDISEEDAKKAIILLLQEYNDHHGFDLSDVTKYFTNEEHWE